MYIFVFFLVFLSAELGEGSKSIYRTQKKSFSPKMTKILRNLALTLDITDKKTCLHAGGLNKYLYFPQFSYCTLLLLYFTSYYTLSTVELELRVQSVQL